MRVLEAIIEERLGKQLGRGTGDADKASWSVVGRKVSRSLALSPFVGTPYVVTQSRDYICLLREACILQDIRRGLAIRQHDFALFGWRLEGFESGRCAGTQYLGLGVVRVEGGILNQNREPSAPFAVYICPRAAKVQGVQTVPVAETCNSHGDAPTP